MYLLSLFLDCEFRRWEVGQMKFRDSSQTQHSLSGRFRGRSLHRRTVRWGRSRTLQVPFRALRVTSEQVHWPSRSSLTWPWPSFVRHPSCSLALVRRSSGHARCLLHLPWPTPQSELAPQSSVIGHTVCVLPHRFPLRAPTPPLGEVCVRPTSLTLYPDISRGTKDWNLQLIFCLYSNPLYSLLVLYLFLLIKAIYRMGQK